jgi:hypothetical protein
VLRVAVGICIAALLIPSSTFVFAEATKTTVAIPRDHRLVTRARVPVHDGDTWLSILTGLDFASTGAPASRIDPKQVTELVAFSSDAALTQGDWIFVVAVSEAGDSRQVVLGLNLYSHNRRFEFRLDDNGTYSKYSRPRP